MGSRLAAAAAELTSGLQSVLSKKLMTNDRVETRQRGGATNGENEAESWV